ncbi:hypothetical protein [Roseateles asaccharophilus]|uniref:Type III secretion protein n=1 Tax=Roseateles asaccharophilus TaxID=582607 RepID=A0ABU2ABN0_9BURK|nr:hypothetical protein [Roseateles asaccharophilus]MDR7333393.1 hypothetical protein [Roseateles asaccharophilus]
MTSITSIQALNPAETWQAWLQQAANETEAAPAGEAHAPEQPAAAAPAPAAAVAPQALGPLAAPAEAHAAVLPMAPVLLTPLSLQQGPELRWRVQDGSAWRHLFDMAGDDDEVATDSELPDEVPEPAADAMPAWAVALMDRLREAAVAPDSALRMRAALQSWRVGLPVLLASPAGLASLQPGRDAASWCWRRWPARWRTARPVTGERWWAVRVGLAAQGRPRTLRELDAGLRLAPGQVSCELRLDGIAPGIAQWAEVLVQAPASPALRTLLGARPSLTWLLCSQPLWPKEDVA